MPVTLSYAAAAAEGNGLPACLPSRAEVHANIYIFYFSFFFVFFPVLFFCLGSWLDFVLCIVSYRYPPAGDSLVVVCCAGRIRRRRVFVGMMRDVWGGGGGRTLRSEWLWYDIYTQHTTDGGGGRMGRYLVLWLEELYRLLPSLFARII